MSTINSSHQGKSQMENVAVKKGAFLLKQHCQQLKESKTKCLLSIILYLQIEIYILKNPMESNS